MTAVVRSPARRLRTLIIADVVVTTAGAFFTLAMALLVVESNALMLLGLFVGAIAAMMAFGLVPLSAGRVGAGLAWLGAANWLVSIVNASVATFTWPLMMSSSLLPAAVAVSFVRRTTLLVYVALSIACATTVAALGLLQDVTGLSDDVPDWLESLVLLLFAPLLAALIMLSAFESSIRLQAALDDELLAHEALADHAEELRRSRSRLVAATDRERRRIERDLHDGAQSRLIAINLRLAKARRLLHDDPATADVVLADLRHELQLAQNELRDLARGVYPAVLTQHGLVPAVQAVADRSPIPTRLDIGTVERYGPHIEAAVYFCVLEATQNACKHAQASSMTVQLGEVGTRLCFEVSDDGVGLAHGERSGVGIDNMQDRIGSIGGWIVVEPGSPLGTSVRGHVQLTGEDTAPTT